MPAADTQQQGQLYIVAAPSGAGKTSLVKALLENDSAVTVSISHTTRAIRPGEREGHDYHFVDRQRFEQLIADGEFIEYARVFDNYYGTSVGSVNDSLRSGKDLILEIDWQGARQVRTRFPAALGIFILPPSRQALQQRLSDRGQDDADTIARRMDAAISEMSHFDEFEYLVINDDFALALTELQSIITSQRLRRDRQQDRRADLLNQLVNPR